MEKLPFQLEGDLSGHTWPIVGDVYIPSCDERTVPVVAIAHGWLAHREAAGLPELAQAIARSGMVAVSFNFSGSGVPAGAEEIRDDRKLAANTIAREVDDLERVVTAIFERVLPGRERFDILRIGACGVDLGGAVALLEAARDTRVKALVSAGAPARLGSFFPPAAWDAWATRGEHRFADPRTGRSLALGREMWRDLRARAADRDPAPPNDVLPAARSLAIPYLVVHGEADDRVPLADARAVFFAGSEHPELEVVAGARHEVETAPAAREGAVRFLEKRLR